jgi:alkylated DNA repair dioxygenase AlkB
MTNPLLTCTQLKECVDEQHSKDCPQYPPILYTKDLNLIVGPDVLMNRLWDELCWTQHEGVPRREYYCPSLPITYTYGSGRGIRTYEPQPSHEIIELIQSKVEILTKTKFDACFVNGYEDQSDSLHWHSDNSPEMDNKRPIAIVSLGVEREIWFCPIEDKKSITKLKLENGSLCLMAKGMQQTHMHRIPKASFQCGKRVSLTFRGFSKEVMK